MSHHANLPFWKTLTAGATAGTVEILVMYPTDVLKTRAQLSSTANKNMFATLVDIVKNEGIGRLYRGIISPVLAEGPKRAVKFATNEQYKDLLRVNGQLSNQRAFVAGAAAGATEAFINTPFETVKVRMQAKTSTYVSTADCVKQTLAKEGPLGLYRGFEAQALRNAVWNGVYFGLIGTIKKAFPTKPGASKVETMLTTVGTGALASTCGTLLNTPLDVAKSRMQHQVIVAGTVPKYNWTLPSVQTIYAEEGFSALYKGLGPRLLRLGPGGGIMLVVFDKVVELLEPY